MSAQQQLVIGLVGFAGSGKDSLAAVWVEQENFVRMSFGDALYGEVSDAFDVSINWMRDRTIKEQPSYLMSLARCKDRDFVNLVLDRVREQDPKMNWSVELNKPRSPREILQLWGTEYRRGQNPNYWTDKVAEQIRRSNFPVVITDTRFENEAGVIQQLDGALVRVTRPGVDAVNDHPSERYAREGFCNIEFQNDGTLDDLPAKAINLLRRIESEVDFGATMEAEEALRQSNEAGLMMQ